MQQQQQQQNKIKEELEYLNLQSYQKTNSLNPATEHLYKRISILIGSQIEISYVMSCYLSHSETSHLLVAFIIWLIDKCWTQNDQMHATGNGPPFLNQINQDGIFFYDTYWRTRLHVFVVPYRSSLLCLSAWYRSWKSIQGSKRISMPEDCMEGELHTPESTLELP